jgi:hypothetical protein
MPIFNEETFKHSLGPCAEQVRGLDLAFAQDLFLPFADFLP